MRAESQCFGTLFALPFRTRVTLGKSKGSYNCGSFHLAYAPNALIPIKNGGLTVAEDRIREKSISGQAMSEFGDEQVTFP
jgi:hypothetical protein